MQRLEYVALYAGLNLLVLLVLAILVIAGRRKHKIVLGDGGNQDFQRAVRAHANAAEYIPGGLVGLLVLALLEPATPTWLFHSAGISLTAGRFLHGAGLSVGMINVGRMGGMMLTFLSYGLMIFGLLYAGLSQQL